MTPNGFIHRAWFSASAWAFRILAVLVAGLLTGGAGAQSLHPFSTDGCSLFPDQSLVMDKDWRNCCVAHDEAYWLGGSEADRLKADEELRACVLEKTGDEALAALMFRGVRLGGSPYFPSSFRWGYGWSYGRFYREPGEDGQDSGARLQDENKTNRPPASPQR